MIYIKASTIFIKKTDDETYCLNEELLTRLNQDAKFSSEQHIFLINDLPGIDRPNLILAICFNSKLKQLKKIYTDTNNLDSFTQETNYYITHDSLTLESPIPELLKSKNTTIHPIAADGSIMETFGRIELETLLKEKSGISTAKSVFATTVNTFSPEKSLQFTPQLLQKLLNDYPLRLNFTSMEIAVCIKLEVATGTILNKSDVQAELTEKLRALPARKSATNLSDQASGSASKKGSPTFGRTSSIISNATIDIDKDTSLLNVKLKDLLNTTQLKMTQTDKISLEQAIDILNTVQTKAELAKALEKVGIYFDDPTPDSPDSNQRLFDEIWAEQEKHIDEKELWLENFNVLHEEQALKINSEASASGIPLKKDEHKFLKSLKKKMPMVRYFAIQEYIDHNLDSHSDAIRKTINSQWNQLKSNDLYRSEIKSEIAEFKKAYKEKIAKSAYTGKFLESLTYLTLREQASAIRAHVTAEPCSRAAKVWNTLHSPDGTRISLLNRPTEVSDGAERNSANILLEASEASVHSESVDTEQDTYIIPTHRIRREKILNQLNFNNKALHELLLSMPDMPLLSFIYDASSVTPDQINAVNAINNAFAQKPCKTIEEYNALLMSIGISNMLFTQEEINCILWEEGHAHGVTPVNEEALNPQQTRELELIKVIWAAYRCMNPNSENTRQDIHFLKIIEHESLKVQYHAIMQYQAKQQDGQNKAHKKYLRENSASHPEHTHTRVKTANHTELTKTFESLKIFQKKPEEIEEEGLCPDKSDYYSDKVNIDTLIALIDNEDEKKVKLSALFSKFEHILNKPDNAAFLLSQVELFKIVYRILRQTSPTPDFAASNFVADELDNRKKTPWEQYYKLQEHIEQTKNHTSARTQQAWKIVQHFSELQNSSYKPNNAISISSADQDQLRLQIKAISTYRLTFFDSTINAIINKEMRSANYSGYTASEQSSNLVTGSAQDKRHDSVSSCF